ILLAEDSPDNQILIGHVLRRAGAEVTIVGNGKLACDATLAAQADNRPFDLVLMDMQMPIVDGYEAASRLRQAGYQRPIRALTAHSMGSDRKKCLDAGCDDFETKPIHRMRLLSLIGSYVHPETTETAPGKPVAQAVRDLRKHGNANPG